MKLQYPVTLQVNVKLFDKTYYTSSIGTNNLGNQIGDPREVQFTVKMDFKPDHGVAPDAHCRAALRSPAYVSVTFVAVRRPGKAQPPPGKTGWRRMLPGGAALAPAYLSVTFVAFVGPVAQPPPAKQAPAGCSAGRLRCATLRDICRSSAR
ncbi:hypothetical protein BANRA_05301 [Klebsiella pneumoniae]|uniref:hypothetical protein n=1 Tax=Klebsiella pneumoniae TaxID=573 RepID=UPI000F0E160C|nr:hypothetical protein BANRA_05301 [Klebsiella pneumoniae]